MTKREWTVKDYFMFAGDPQKPRVMHRTIHKGRTTQWLYRLTDGRVISIIRGDHSYGGPQGLFEIFPGSGEDVIGWLRLGEVRAWLRNEDAKIAARAARAQEQEEAPCQ